MGIIDLKDAKPSDFLEFKHKGRVAFILGRLLKMCEPWWDGWGWHLAILWERVTLAGQDGWKVLESTGKGVQLNFHSITELESKCRVHRWLESQPTPEAMDKFLNEYLRKPYDVACYIWTGAQYLFRHFWNRRIPRLLDDLYTCWELVFEFADVMGRRISADYDCPIITDFIKRVDGIPKKGIIRRWLHLPAEAIRR